MDGSRTIPTTHTGSLARPAPLLEMLAAQEAGNAVDATAFDSAVTAAVNVTVARQAQIGLWVINDGEQSKTSFAAYIAQRLSGISGPREPMPVTLEAREFPEYYSMRPVNIGRPSCDGPLGWADFSQVEKDVANLKAATAGLNVDGVFMTAVSPGTIANFFPNAYYPSRDAYMEAVAETMKREYDAIAAAGFILQLDCPDLALRSFWFPDLSVEEFRGVVARNIEALNYATRDIPAERVRMHVCWGAGEGPHKHDVPLAEIVDLLLAANARYVSIVGANGRHEHEWKVWQETKLPEGRVLIPGVVDSTTNIIEHPEVVAERLVRYAGVVGRDNLMGGVDCGFGTSARSTQVEGRVAYAKLESLAEGAALASKQLWP